MRLIRIEIEEFGKLRSRSFALGKGITLFEGPNESGKSTLLAFLRFAFYGFPRRIGPNGEERELRLSWQGHRAAGRLILENEQGEFSITRSVVRQGGTERESFSEQLSVIELSTGCEAQLDGRTPGEYFLGLPAALYDSTLCLRQSDAERVSSPQVGEAVGELLFAGPSGIRADTAQEKLNLARRELQHRKGRGGRIAELEDAVAAQESALRGAREDAEQLDALREQERTYRTQLEAHRAQLEEVLAAFEQAGIAQTLSLFEQWHIAQRRLDQKKLERESLLAQQAGSSLPDAQALAQLEGAVRQRAAAKEAMARMEPELLRLRAFTHPKEMLDAQELILQKGGAETVLADFQRSQQRAGRRRGIGLLLLLCSACFAAVFTLIATGALAWLWERLPAGTYHTAIAITSLAVGALSLFVGLGFLHGAWRARRRVHAWVKRLHAPNVAMFRTYLGQCAAEAQSYEAHRSVLEGLERERATFLAQESGAEDYIKQLMQQYGFSDVYQTVEDLPHCLEALRERQQRQQAELENARLETERAQAAVEALAPSLAGKNEAALRARFVRAPEEGSEVLLRKQAFLKEGIAGMEQKLGACTQRIAALEATAKDPIQVQARLQLLTEELSHARTRLEAVDLAISAMESAVDTLRRGLTPKLCEEASAILSVLTDGAYTVLHPAPDFSVRLESEVGALPLSRFSAGCRDAAHLALRLGLLATLSEQRLPLLLDEAFARLDDGRTCALLSLLQNYCAAGGQCLLFSCHRREGAFLDGSDFTHIPL